MISAFGAELAAAFGAEKSVALGEAVAALTLEIVLASPGQGTGQPVRDRVRPHGGAPPQGKIMMRKVGQ